MNVRLNSTGPVTVWADAAQFEEGKTATDYSPMHPVELALNSSHIGAIYFDADPVSLDIVWGGTIPTNATLKGTVENLMGGSRPLPDLKFPAAQWTIPIDPKFPHGMFKVRAVVVNDSGKEVSGRIEKIFACLPKPREIAPARSYFGGHVSPRPDLLALMRAVGIRWVRLHDCSGATLWANVETERDQFQFIDQGIDAARAAGLEVLGLLNGAPAWTSVKPRATSGYFSAYNFPDAPDGIELWTRYVKETVAHYKGRISYWEVWNEPWHKSFFLGTPEQYGEMLKIAYTQTKSVDPAIQILGFNSAGHKADWTRAALAISGTQSFDLFSYHDYNPSLYGGNPGNPERLTGRFAAMQKEVGESKPFWNTEGGPGHIASWYGKDSKSLSPRMQMAHIVRFNVMQMAAGVKRFFYYSLHGSQPSGVDGFCALEHDGSIRPVLAASAVQASLIDGAIYQGRVELMANVEAHQFQQDDGTFITVVWTGDGSGQTLPLAANIQALDILGNRLSDSSVKVSAEPIYLIQTDKDVKKP